MIYVMIRHVIRVGLFGQQRRAFIEICAGQRAIRARLICE